jgi:hypothetical protein
MGHDYTEPNREYEGPAEKTEDDAIKLLKVDLKASLPDGVESFVYYNYAGPYLSMKWVDRKYAYRAMAICLRHFSSILTQTRFSVTVTRDILGPNEDSAAPPVLERAGVKELEGIRKSNEMFPNFGCTVPGSVYCLLHESSWITDAGKAASREFLEYMKQNGIQTYDDESDEMWDEDEP